MRGKQARHLALARLKRNSTDVPPDDPLASPASTATTGIVPISAAPVQNKTDSLAMDESGDAEEYESEEEQEEESHQRVHWTVLHKRKRIWMSKAQQQLKSKKRIAIARAEKKRLARMPELPPPQQPLTPQASESRTATTSAGLRSK